MGDWRVPALPNKRFEPTPRARLNRKETAETAVSCLAGLSLHSNIYATTNPQGAALSLHSNKMYHVTVTLERPFGQRPSDR